MPTPDTSTKLYAIAALRKAVNAAAKRDAAIVLARQAGLTHAEIGRAAGLSRARVQQIVSEAQRTCTTR